MLQEKERSSASIRERIPELDLLRLTAAVAVMLFHYFSWAHIDGPARYGWLGVPLFFSISGFVILWSAMGKSPGQFALSRFSRLYPSYWLCVGIATFAALLSGHHISAGQFLANLTMLQNPIGEADIDQVYWTLYVELKFYVMVGVLLLLRQQRWMERWLLLWLAGSLVSVFMPVVGKLTLGVYAPYFIFGATCFLVRRDGLSPLRIAMLLVAAALGIHSSTAVLMVTYEVTSVPAVVGILLTIDAAFVGLALGHLRLPGAGYAHAAGCLTYPLYLIHSVPGSALWHALPLPGPARILVVTTASLVAAGAIARMIEYRACGRFNRYLSLHLLNGAASPYPGR